jgi:hypothetical protein
MDNLYQSGEIFEFSNFQIFKSFNQILIHQNIGSSVRGICVRDSSGKPAMQVSRRPIACGLGANSPTPLEARPNQNMAKLNNPYNYITRCAVGIVNK